MIKKQKNKRNILCKTYIYDSVATGLAGHSFVIIQPCDRFVTFVFYSDK